MSDVDYYDVQAMIRDAVTAARAEWEAMVRNLRDEVNDDLDALSSEIRERVSAALIEGRTEV